MSSARLCAAIREKELRLAIFRIEQGRARTKATKVSISSVAREAGVTPALIHNHYPAIAESIRIKQGASSREQRDAKQNQLHAERNLTKALRSQLNDLQRRLEALASINETLVVENQGLKARLASGNVVSMPVHRS